MRAGSVPSSIVRPDVKGLLNRCGRFDLEDSATGAGNVRLPEPIETGTALASAITGRDASESFAVCPGSVAASSEGTTLIRNASVLAPGVASPG